MKFLAQIKPRTIIAITLVVAFLMFGSAVVELLESRRELFHVLEEHSLSLAETIERSSANIVLSTEQVQNQLSERLLNNAYYIARLDSMRMLAKTDLRAFAEANAVSRINIFNLKGERVLGSHDPLHGRSGAGERFSPRLMLRPILEEGQATLILGLRSARFEGGQRYAVAIRRTAAGGGAIVLNLDAGQLLEFRKRIGIGKMIRDLGDNTGIDYVVIQDRDGILAATSQVDEIASVDTDSSAALVLAGDTVVSRRVAFRGKETFEVMKRLSVEGSTVGVLRIGLSMDELRSVEERMTRRMLLMSLALVAVGGLVFTAIVASQNYRLVSRQYAEIKSFTGSILENMRDAVVTVNGEDRITIFNRQAELLFGLVSADVIGKTLEELPVEKGKCLSAIFIAEAQELTLECPENRTRIVSTSVSGTIRSDGALESKTAVIKDLTESRQLELEMKRKEKLSAMGELASGVAHEIRNPLNAISMIAQRYEKEFVPRSGLHEYRSLTGVLQKEVKRVNSIVQQFLRFARPPKPQLADVDARQFVDHVAILFKGQAEAKEVRFNAVCTADGLLFIDAGQMTQALINLLQNSLDAASRGGSIDLHVSKDQKSVSFRVTDTGSGIAAEQLGRVFDLYFTTKPDGTGMGLAITQQIVTQHGGVIRVESESGKGSTFLILLPLGQRV